MECSVSVWAWGEKRLYLQCNHECCQARPLCVCVCRGRLMEMKQGRWEDLSTWIFINHAADSNEHWTGGLGHTDHKVGAWTRRGAARRQWQIVERSSTPCRYDEKESLEWAYIHTLRHSRSNLETQTRSAACSALFSLHTYTWTPGAIRQMWP